jgi:creatinine amidohydrolase/Fe(II)-dependent formamide hydrolase-like protein
VPKTGLLTTARTSSAEKGKMIVEEVVEEYLKVIERRFK